MMTVRQIEKRWDARQYRLLLSELLTSRSEAAVIEHMEGNGQIAVAAAAILRLSELGKPDAPIVATLIRTIIAAQQSDGGWTDPMVTALCVRALLADGGGGQAVDRGLEFLASLQQPAGAWPHHPLRRMPADSFATAFVLFQLGDRAEFRAVARVGDAVAWMNAQPNSDAATATLWRHASLRCRVVRHPIGQLERFALS